jgi:hypothetical protein
MYSPLIVSPRAPLAGAEVKPEKPYTLTPRPRLGRLRLTQVSRDFSPFNSSFTVN